MIQTRIINVRKTGKYPRWLGEVSRALAGAKPVVFPTDTIYGIGVNAFDPKGVKALYRLKKRDRTKPLVWMLGSPDDLSRYVQDVPAYARHLICRFWPGALTLIFTASSYVRRTGTVGNTIGIRIPGYSLLRRIIIESAVPLAVTSANISGGLLPVQTSQLSIFKGKVPYILDAGRLTLGKESTVVDVTGTSPRILREGAISRTRIYHAAGV